jgi:hypothetical protein
MNKTITLIVFLFSSFLLMGSSAPIFIEHTFEWDELAQKITVEGQLVESWGFREGVSSSEFPGFYFYTSRFPVDGHGQLSVEVLEATYENFPVAPDFRDAPLSGRLSFQTTVVRERNQHFGKLSFIPIINQNGQYQRLKSIKLQVRLLPAPSPVSFRDPNTTESVLIDGQIYKIAVSQNGMHKITYEFLQGLTEIDINSVDPRQIKIYGNQGGKLPYYTEATRTDDLLENNIFISGESDGSFDPGDYILFYAHGPDKWYFDEGLGQFTMEKNIYDLKNYYFIKFDGENGRRVSTAPQGNPGSTTVSSFDDYVRLEDDKVNLHHDWDKAQGSAKNWYGDHFKVTRIYNYNNLFQLPGLITTVPVKVRASAALRAKVSSRFYIDIENNVLESNAASGVNSINSSSDNTRSYASRAILNDSLLLSNDNISLSVRYPFPQNAGDQSEGWIDYIQLNARRNLQMSGAQLSFRDLQSLENGRVSFRVQGVDNNHRIWEVTEPHQARVMPNSSSGSSYTFHADTDILREYVAFDPGQPLYTPEPVGLVANQNLHGIQSVDLLIIYHKNFEQAAQRLADHRASHNGYSVATAEVEQIYNEFASGRKDPTAIRDMARMLYDRSSTFRYVLLLGDGSFDSRDLYGLGGDFIPVYQKESFNPVEAYPSDDFYGLLYGTSSTDPLKGDLTVSVGRLPVKSLEEAERSVDKIIHYDASEATLGDWRTKLVFVGDDNDGAGDIDHYKDADRIAEDVNELNPYTNLEKIYLDAFPQESTPGGERIPQATEKLNNSIFKGALAITYLGHGGAKGWAQERVLNITDISSWDNYDQMPIFITATCSFTGYDDPAFVTAGEETFLNDRGGAIALMTTTRAVYANSNVRMTTNALDYLFRRENGRGLSIGEAFRQGKNDVSGDFNINNSRKFTLIGDPSMGIPLPRYQVATTMINGQLIDPADTLYTDTLQALQKVTIAGQIVDENGNLLENFNGIIYPSIFDKAQMARTIGQGDNDIYSYRVQDNVLFKGRASVTNGRFEFTFVVPKDINYEYGYGKISYYAAANNSLVDAAGSFEKIVIGGTSPNALEDDEGPIVEVFMNTEDFVFGGITNAEPTLLVKLQDANGINVVGNSIGHDLEGTLNDDTQNTILLNEFYESELDDYTRGAARYPMSQLPEGRHKIEVKAWDVANNSSVGYTEFIVASSEEVILEHVLNYPNPFTDRTCFQFDHNLPNQEMDIMIQVFTVSGRLVKTLQSTIVSDGALRQDDCIEWDGRDDYGGRLARGVYLYKVKVRAVNTGVSSLNGESEFEKLVILK